MALASLLAVLKKIQSRHPPLGKRLAQAQALNLWEQAVGDTIAKHAKAIRVQEGVLWVEVDHPIWKTELHYRKRQILAILNSSHPTQDSSAEPASPALFEDIRYVDRRAAAPSR